MAKNNIQLPEWLARQIEIVRKRIASWPEWKREWARIKSSCSEDVEEENNKPKGD